jgi:hypothetical protein
MTPQEQVSVSEVERIRDQFRRAFEGEAWHGPSVLALLDGVTAQQAAAWERACKRRLEGDPAQLTDEEDWESIDDTSEAAWKQTKQQLIDNHRELMQAIARLDESRLNEPIIKDPNIPFSSVYATLHGGVQHDLYHAGQIAIVKKALVNL